MPGTDVAMISAIDAIGKEQRAAAKPSGLENKKAGIVIPGDSDGVQSIIASLANFFNAVGLELPPFATLSVLWQAQAKNKDTPRQELLEKYEKDYASTTTE
jgi:hypothetical protein